MNENYSKNITINININIENFYFGESTYNAWNNARKGKMSENYEEHCVKF